MAPKVRLDQLTRQEVSEITQDSVVILPIGATEQHGPHLPLSVDHVIVSEIAARSCLKLKDQMQVYYAPVLHYGSSHHHLPYPVLSLSSETLLSVLKDLLRSLALTGFERIMILNSHGGNDEAIRIVTRDISREEQVCIAAASYWNIAWDSLVEVGALEKERVPGHAGGFETSLMLAVDADQVQLEKRSLGKIDMVQQQVMPDPMFIQQPGQSTRRDGISDDASFASANKGEKYFEIIVREICKVIERFKQQ